MLLLLFQNRACPHQRAGEGGGMGRGACDPNLRYFFLYCMFVLFLRLFHEGGGGGLFNEGFELDFVLFIVYFFSLFLIFLFFKGEKYLL